MSSHKITIASVSAEWLDMKKLTVKQSTFSRYYCIVQKHIIPELGGLPFAQVNSSVINSFTCRKLGMDHERNEKKPEYRHINGDTLAVKTVRDICTVLKSIIKYGTNEYQMGNLAGNTVLPKKRKENREVLSLQELRKIEEYLLENQSDARCAGLLLCMYTGIRLGEICALRWRDIDLERELLYINHTIQRITIPNAKSIQKTKIIMDDPKTFSSLRTIPISRKIYPMIRGMHSELNQEAYFLTNSKRYIEPRNYQYFFKRILKKADIRDVNFHILRHTFASRCVEAGMDVKTLSEILGHANTNITLSYYVHSSLESKRRQINMLKI